MPISPLVADVPAWLALVPVLASVLGSVIVAVVSARATEKVASQSAQATTKAASESTIAESRKRSAEWQILKRDLYAEFLQAARRLRQGSDDPDDRADFLRLRDKVLLYGDEGVLTAVGELPENLASVDDATWTQLIEKLREHAGRPSG